MKVTAAVFALAATGAYAQSGLTSILSGVSQTCQSTILSLATSGNFSSCLNIPQLIPILTPLLSSSNTTTNSSLIPIVDQISAIECGQSGCTNATLTSAYNSIITGCSTDLQMYNLTNSTVKAVFSAYPLAREIICLKTTKPFNGTAPIPVNSSSYNSTNGTFCTSSLLTDISSKFQQNISISFFTQLYQNISSSNNLTSITSKFNATDLCDDCIFATADILGLAYPGIGNLTLGKVLSKLSMLSNSTNSTNSTTMPTPGMNATTPAAPVATPSLPASVNATLPSSLNTTQLYNTTLMQLLDGTCMSRGFMYTTNGTLPSTIYLSAVGSTFPYNLTAGNQTYAAPAMTTPIRRNMAAVKGRWVGRA